MSQRYCYRKLEESEIRPQLLDRCTHVLSFAAGSLPIPDLEPRIVWVEPVDDLEAIEQILGPARDFRMEEADLGQRGYARILRSLKPEVGYTPGNRDLSEFWLQASIPLESHYVEFAVLHERRHVWQKRSRPAIFEKESLAEGDAYPYAYSALKKYLRIQGCLTLELEEEINSQCRTIRERFERRYPGTPYDVSTDISCASGSNLLVRLRHSPYTRCCWPVVRNLR